jgi:hypothetical protein
MLLEAFYLTNVLVTLDLIQCLLYVRRFITDISCSMEFDPFRLNVKDLAIRSVLARYNSSGPLYTVPFPAPPTSTLRVVSCALVVTASSST